MIIIVLKSTIRNLEILIRKSSSTRSVFKKDNFMSIAPVRSTKGTKKPNLRDEVRNADVYFLLQRRKDEANLKMVVWLMQLHILKFWRKQWNKCVIGAWRRVVAEILVVMFYLEKKTGTKKRPIDKLSAIADVPLSKPGNLRSLSCSINVPKITLIRRLQEKAIIGHSSSVSPFLKKEKKARTCTFRFAAS